jgi:hypothetical protein
MSPTNPTHDLRVPNYRRLRFQTSIDIYHHHTSIDRVAVPCMFDAEGITTMPVGATSLSCGSLLLCIVC